MKKYDWKKIPDAHVQHVWKKAEDDDCGEGPKTVVVPPSWYEENGTPTCFCGEDMVYSHTEILTPNAHTSGNHKNNHRSKNGKVLRNQSTQNRGK